ncbi:ribosome maturation factor RimM [Sandaracinus amylolyticus]|uniref:Ribosome maturation factor RimM n=1 Tax=Sandaracinus amylolyticus TaxID=927083 RepID=A0A0F6W3V8_9BACT|nr:ribosome maturation factor RimM [Sandaracinus amylolyticus]AKF06806.1 16S rRNA processing protein RimM [Sandaracinus amylolyticus]
MGRDLRAESDDLVVLGAITRPHGVRGEVRVHRFNPDSPLLLELERVVVRAKSGDREHAVLGSKRSGDADVLRLEGVTTVEQAEALRGAEIAARRAWMPEPDEDEVYHVDLIGLRVIEDGVELGVVDEVLAYPSVDCLRVPTARGVIEIPLIEPYVIDVDVEGGRIEVAHTADFEPVDPAAG